MDKVRVNDSTDEAASCVSSFPNSECHSTTAVEGKEDDLWGIIPQTSSAKLTEISEQTLTRLKYLAIWHIYETSTFVKIHSFLSLAQDC